MENSSGLVPAQQVRMLAHELNSSELDPLISRFATVLDVAPGTQSTYARALRAWRMWTAEGGNPADVRAFKAHLRAAGRSPYTIGVYLTALRRFFGWAVEMGELPINPAQGVKGDKKPRGHLRDNMTEAEARRVLATINRGTLPGKRDYALLTLLARCGLRLIEAARADVGDLRTKDGERVLFVQGKGRTAKDDFVLLIGSTYDALADYVSARGAKAEEPLFQACGNRSHGRMTTRALRERVNAYLRAAGVKTPKVTAHSFRHSAITWAILGGANPLAVQRMARHASFDTTQLYFHESGRTGPGAAERFVPELGAV
jgi:integrase/recombinase XerD